MSKDKQPSIFLKSNGCYCVSFPSNVVRKSQYILKMEEYHLDIPQFYRGHIHFRKAFKLVEREEKYSMDSISEDMMTEV